MFITLEIVTALIRNIFFNIDMQETREMLLTYIEIVTCNQYELTKYETNEYFN